MEQPKGFQISQVGNYVQVKENYLWIKKKQQEHGILGLINMWGNKVTKEKILIVISTLKKNKIA